LTNLFRHRGQSTKGFALIAVIWTLGLISLLSVAAMVGTKYRIRLASKLSSVVEASAAAESAINLGIVAARQMASGQTIGNPLRCRLPGGEMITVAIEDEAGKVDLNSAAPAVLIGLFSALSHDQAIGNKITAQILAFRDANGGEPNSSGTKAHAADNKHDDQGSASFATILQLDQIDAISPKLFREALGFVTVRSGSAEPTGAAASLALRELLNLDPKTQSPTPDSATMSEVTIRADVGASNGVHYIREALVSLGAESRPPYVIREWRRGNLERGVVAARTRDDTAVPAEDCLRIGKGSGSNS
jgi:general secretion pathway protein K